MYVALARTVLTDVDHDRIVEEVREFRRRNPGRSDDELADRLIRRTALCCAAVGAVASAPPGFLAIVPLAADLSYQVLALNRLVLTIARIYGRPTTREQRGLAVGASLALGGVAQLLRRSVVRGVARSLQRQSAARLVPVVGAVLGSLLCYGAARAIGRQARDYYRGRRMVSRAQALARR